MPTPILRTERLQLRPLAPRDAEPLYAIMSDDETMRFWDWPAFRDYATVAEIVAGQISDMVEGRSAYWAVSLLSDSTVFGACDLSEIDPRQGRAELGFLFNRGWWGNGYAVEAMDAVVDYAFESLGLERLWARLHAGNEGSRRLLERLGFAYEGTLAGHVVRDGFRRDCLIYGRLKG
ncbi:MAG TPA: GNAT family N-acetyltransferase [Rhizomicrobium sp.]|jgi:RimJ/RimL family protein N-acetyltransferase